MRQAIVKLHKEKHSIKEISEKVKCSKSVVGRVVKSYNDTGKIVSAFKTGRLRKTSAGEDRIMQRMSLKDRFKSCTEIKRVMNSTSCVNVSRQTVSRWLQEIGLFNQTPKKKPLVSSKNKKRLEFVVSRIVKNWFVLVVEDVQLSLRARAHLLNIDCTCIFIVFWLFKLFFSILSLTFGRSKFENK